jgi:hypothetical protein
VKKAAMMVRRMVVTRVVSKGKRRAVLKVDKLDQNLVVTMEQMKVVSMAVMTAVMTVVRSVVQLVDP